MTKNQNSTSDIFYQKYCKYSSINDNSKSYHQIDYDINRNYKNSTDDKDYYSLYCKYNFENQNSTSSKDYFSLYIKYKKKYLNLKESYKNKQILQKGASKSDFFLNESKIDSVRIPDQFNFSTEIIKEESILKNNRDTINKLHHYNSNSPSVRGEGIIFGHGIQIPNLFCIIPDNIIVRPTTKSGTVSNRAFYNIDPEDLDNLYRRQDREYLRFSDVYDRYYFPSGLIPNLLVTFRSTYP